MVGGQGQPIDGAETMAKRHRRIDEELAQGVLLVTVQIPATNCRGDAPASAGGRDHRTSRCRLPRTTENRKATATGAATGWSFQRGIEVGQDRVTVVVCLDRSLRKFGGVPTYALTASKVAFASMEQPRR